MLIKLIRTLQAPQTAAGVAATSVLAASSSQLDYFLAGVAAAIEFGEGEGRPVQPRHDVFPV